MKTLILSLLLAWTCYAPTPLFFAQNGAMAAANEPVISGLVLSLTGDSLSAGSVTTWTDASGNGYDCTQGTVASRPTAVAGPNGKMVVTFDGVDDFLTGSSIVVGNDDFTVLVVGYAVAGTASYARVIAMASNADDRDYADANGFLFGVTTAPLLRVYRSLADRGGVSITLSDWGVWSSDWSGSQNLVRIDNGTAGTASNSGTLNANKYRLGAAFNMGSLSGTYLNGSIGAVRVFNRQITDTERADWVAWARSKYGI